MSFARRCQRRMDTASGLRNCHIWTITVITFLSAWERAKLLVEPSSAVALAAVLTEEFRSIPSRPRRIGVILSGGNVDLDRLPWQR